VEGEEKTIYMGRIRVCMFKRATVT